MQFGRLLQTVEAAAAFLAWPAHRESASRLLEHTRANPGSGEQAAAVARVRCITDDRIADFALAALLDAAKMEQLALRFFTSTEANIRTALGLSGTPRPFSPLDLTGVFGVMPKEYLGASLGIESSVGTDRIAIRTSRGMVVLQHRGAVLEEISKEAGWKT